MPVKKISIALHPDIAAAVALSAGHHDESISAWIERAARRALVLEDGLAAVDEYEEEHGAFTGEELAEARRIVDEELSADRRRSA